jgi:hypothetical protein
MFKPSSFHHLALNIFLERVLRIKMKRDKENEWEEEEKIKIKCNGVRLWFWVPAHWKYGIWFVVFQYVQFYSNII